MEQYHGTNIEESTVSIHQILGYILLFIGIGMCIWVFFSAVNLFKNPNDAQLFEMMLPFKSGSDPILVDDTVVHLPRELYFALAFIVSIFALSIAGFIGGAFLSGGVGLLNPTGEKLEKRIEERVKQIERKLSDSFKGN